MKRRHDRIVADQITAAAVAAKTQLELQQPHVNAITRYLERRKNVNGFGADFEWTLQPKGGHSAGPERNPLGDRQPSHRLHRNNAVRVRDRVPNPLRPSGDDGGEVHSPVRCVSGGGDGVGVHRHFCGPSS